MSNIEQMETELIEETFHYTESLRRTVGPMITLLVASTGFGAAAGYEVVHIVVGGLFGLVISAVNYAIARRFEMRGSRKAGVFIGGRPTRAVPTYNRTV